VLIIFFRDNDVGTMAVVDDFAGDAKAAANVYDLVGEETASDDGKMKLFLNYSTGFCVSFYV
jgi:hypothetical protein